MAGIRIWVASMAGIRTWVAPAAGIRTWDTTNQGEVGEGCIRQVDAEKWRHDGVVLCG